MDQLFLMITATHLNCQVTLYTAHVVFHGRLKPLIGKHGTEITAGQIQQLLTELSATDAIWFLWHIVNADNMNGWEGISEDYRSQGQKLY